LPETLPLTVVRFRSRSSSASFTSPLTVFTFYRTAQAAQGHLTTDRMEAEFAFEPFGKQIAADAVDLEGAFTRRLDHIIDPAGKGAKQPASMHLPGILWLPDGAIACLGELNFGTAGVTGVCILGNMYADSAFFAGTDFHRSRMCSGQPCRR